MQVPNKYYYYLRCFLILAIASVLTKSIIHSVIQKEFQIVNITKDSVIFSIFLTILFVTYSLKRINGITFRQLSNNKNMNQAYISLCSKTLEEAKALIEKQVPINNAKIIFENDKMKIVRKRFLKRIIDDFSLLKIESINKIEISMNLSKYGKLRDLRKLENLSLVQNLILNNANA